MNCPVGLARHVTASFPRGKIVRESGFSCSLRHSGSSDGRLKHLHVCSWNEVNVLSINQGIPLIEVLLQSCRSPDNFSIVQNLSISEFELNVLVKENLILPRCRCRKASVALLQRSMATSGSISPFSFMSFPIQLPVRKVKSGKLW